ncbi:MAG: transcription elongation factor GreB [Gammaproteobacteria bacterium]|nr:MAG: transcription elongation factor GreB [Gammaproteobacteria bacterium]
MGKSHYITRAGYDALERELNQLWKVERPEITKKVAWAASLGDRSENADYQYNKKRLREIDRRVRFLSRRLDELQVVYPSPQQAGKVFFGAQVALEDEQGERVSYQLVGADEFDSSKHKISINSPLARALLGQAVGDEVRVQTPSGVKYWSVLAITYPD